MITYNPKIPFLVRIGNPGIAVGTEITIIGRVLASATRFDIDLSQGADCSIVVFHFNPRFAPHFVGKDANVVVRNTLSADGWGNEERHSPPFPFLKGKCFKIVIRCGHDLLQISVDGQSFVDYKHRLPLEDINFLSISNGIEVSVIEVSGPK